MTDTEILDFLEHHRAWLTFSQSDANADIETPWRCSIFGSLTSVVRWYKDGKTPREAVDLLKQALESREPWTTKP